MKFKDYFWIVQLGDLNLLKSSWTIAYTFDVSQPSLYQQQRQPFLQNRIIQRKMVTKFITIIAHLSIPNPRLLK